ncbi:MAG: hypothetical protein QNJ90_14800 [Planctomycetota bacterium]|nr:hypothetical protein [Planctomycetota bacterium]
MGARRVGAGTWILLALVLPLSFAAAEEPTADDRPPWLHPELPISVGADGSARSIYQPEFRDAPWLREQLLQQKIAGLRADLTTPIVPVARPPGARSTPPPVPGRILLTGSLEAVREARARLAKLDLAPRAVLVSLLVTEVVRRRRSERGGSLLFDKALGPSPGNALFRSFSTSFEPDSFLRSTLTGVTPFEGTTLFMGNDSVGGAGFEYALRMLQKEGEAEFLAWPNLLVNEGQPATMTSGRTVPQVLLDNDAGETIRTRSELTGLRLRVTPRTIGREHAVLDLDVWLRLPEEVTGAEVVPGTLRLKTRQVTTRLTVRDREPLLLGGIVLRRAQRDRRGLPRPRAAAALDPLHSTRVRDAAETEIVFLIRPRVVPPGQRPAELDPATYRAWTTTRRLPDPWKGVKEPRGSELGKRGAAVSR